MFIAILSLTLSFSYEVKTKVHQTRMLAQLNIIVYLNLEKVTRHLNRLNIMSQFIRDLKFQIVGTMFLANGIKNLKKLI